MAAKKSAASKKPATVQPDETREQAFVRLANKRVNRAIKDISLIGNLGAYPHTPEQAEAIIGAVQAAVDSLTVRVMPRVAEGAQAFKL